MFILMQCPNCGASLEVDENRETAFCTYCGAKMVREKQLVELSGSVNINRQSDIDNLLVRAKRFMSVGDLDSAYSYYDRILDINADEKRAEAGIIKVLSRKAENAVDDCDYEKAKMLYKQILSMRPDSKEAEEGLRIVYKSENPYNVFILQKNVVSTIFGKSRIIVDGKEVGLLQPCPEFTFKVDVPIGKHYVQFMSFKDKKYFFEIDDFYDMIYINFTKKAIGYDCYVEKKNCRE